MSAASARAARRERQAAELLGSRRVHRARYERAPDVEPVRLSDGTVLVPESKTRKALPRWLVAAVAQARGYLPGCVPLVVLSETGGEPLGLLPLRDLSRLLGLRQEAGPAQLPLAAAVPELWHDEQRVLDVLARRLALGRKAYGPLDVKGDGRDWNAEATEELLDACVYLACQAMRGGKVDA